MNSCNTTFSQVVRHVHIAAQIYIKIHHFWDMWIGDDLIAINLAPNTWQDKMMPSKFEGGNWWSRWLSIRGSAFFGEQWAAEWDWQKLKTIRVLQRTHLYAMIFRMDGGSFLVRHTFLHEMCVIKRVQTVFLFKNE